MADEAFKDKIKSIQVPRKPIVDQKSASGSTQTHHTSGRVDANVVIDTPIKSSMGINNDNNGGAET